MNGAIGNQDEEGGRRLGDFSSGIVVQVTHQPPNSYTVAKECREKRVECSDRKSMDCWVHYEKGEEGGSGISNSCSSVEREVGGKRNELKNLRRSGVESALHIGRGGKIAAPGGGGYATPIEG